MTDEGEGIGLLSRIENKIPPGGRDFMILGRCIELKGIITYHTEEYGNIRVKLAEVLDSRGITRNRLATLTGAKYAIIDRY